MNVTRIAALAATAAILSACASTGPTYSEAQATLPRLAAEQGRIVVYRSSFIAAAVQPSVLLNGQVVGGSQPNGFYFVDRPPGDVVVSTSTEVERKVSFTLTAGEQRFVRLSPAIGILVGRIVPELVDPAEAGKELKDLRWVGDAMKPR